MRSIIFVFIFLFATNADARQQYKSDLPANREVFGECNVCHTDIAVNRARNEFGLRAQSFSDGSRVDWNESVYRGLKLYEHDTDGDGYTNGFELGDPNGTWDATQPYPSADVTYDPSDPNSNPCGNGMIEGPEDCEGDSVGAATCLSEGYEAGTLICNGCFFDFTSCGPKMGTNNGTNNTNNSTGPGTNNSNNNTTNTNNATTNNNNSNSTSNPNTNTGDTTTGNTSQNPTNNNNPPSSGLNDITGTGGCSSISGSSSWAALFVLAFFFNRRKK